MVHYSQMLLARLMSDQRGLTAVEYAVLGAIVVGAIVAIGTDFRTNLSGAFTRLFTNISG